MSFTPQYLDLLRKFEGYFAEPYICPAGKCTIGYGTNLEAHRKFIPYPDIRDGNLTGKALKNMLINRGMRWDKSKADEAMIEELTETHEALLKKCSAYKTLLDKGEQCRADALLDMAYNMGVASLLTFKNTLPKIEAGNYAAGVEGMRNSRWYKQVGRRSKAVCHMMETGEYPDWIR